MDNYGARVPLLASWGASNGPISKWTFKLPRFPRFHWGAEGIQWSTVAPGLCDMRSSRSPANRTCRPNQHVVSRNALKANALSLKQPIIKGGSVCIHFQCEVAKKHYLPRLWLYPMRQHPTLASAREWQLLERALPCFNGTYVPCLSP